MLGRKKKGIGLEGMAGARTLGGECRVDIVLEEGPPKAGSSEAGLCGSALDSFGVWGAELATVEGLV